MTISKVWPNIREKSCQKFVAISITSRSILMSFCQINVTIIMWDFGNVETVTKFVETVIIDFENVEVRKS